MKNRILLGLLCLLLIAPICLFAQSTSESGLTLRGTRSSSIASCKNSGPDKECIKRRMTFENKGNESVIIFNPTLGFGSGIRIVKEYRRNREKNNASDIEFAQRKVLSDPEELQKFESLVSFLDSDRPPENLMIILKPGEAFDFEESFVLPRKEPRIFPSKKEMASLQGSYFCMGGRRVICYEVGDYSRYTYEISTFPFIEDRDLLVKLATRWKRYGKLPIDETGTYSITSEPIK